MTPEVPQFYDNKMDLFILNTELEVCEHYLRPRSGRKVIIFHENASCVNDLLVNDFIFFQDKSTCYIYIFPSYISWIDFLAFFFIDEIYAIPNFYGGAKQVSLRKYFRENFLKKELTLVDSCPISVHSSSLSFQIVLDKAQPGTLGDNGVHPPIKSIAPLSRPVRVKP